MPHTSSLLEESLAADPVSLQVGKVPAGGFPSQHPPEPQPEPEPEPEPQLDMFQAKMLADKLARRAAKKAGQGEGGAGQGFADRFAEPEPEVRFVKHFELSPSLVDRH
eukprot:SAG11_NODE_2610_length_3173_cov_2.271308_3_plen_108_part_00